MFVYQNKDRAICVTFKDNKPVEKPEYVITIDKEAGTLTVDDSNAVVSTEKQIKEENTVTPEPEDKSEVEEPVVNQG